MAKRAVKPVVGERPAPLTVAELIDYLNDAVRHDPTIANHIVVLPVDPDGRTFSALPARLDRAVSVGRFVSRSWPNGDLLTNGEDNALALWPT